MTRMKATVSDHVKRHRAHIQHILDHEPIVPHARQTCLSLLRELKSDPLSFPSEDHTYNFDFITNHVEWRREYSHETLDIEKKLDLLLRTFIEAEFGQFHALDCKQYRRAVKDRATCSEAWRKLDIDRWLADLNRELDFYLPSGLRQLEWDHGTWELRYEMECRDEVGDKLIKKACGNLHYDFDLALYVVRQYGRCDETECKDLESFVVNQHAADLDMVFQGALDTVNHMFTEEEAERSTWYKIIIPKHRDFWMLKSPTFGRWLFKHSIQDGHNGLCSKLDRRPTFLEIQRMGMTTSVTEMQESCDAIFEADGLIKRQAMGPLTDIDTRRLETLRKASEQSRVACWKECRQRRRMLQGIPKEQPDDAGNENANSALCYEARLTLFYQERAAAREDRIKLERQVTNLQYRLRRLKDSISAELQWFSRCSTCRISMARAKST